MRKPYIMLDISASKANKGDAMRYINKENKDFQVKKKIKEKLFK